MVILEAGSGGASPHPSPADVCPLAQCGLSPRHLSKRNPASLQVIDDGPH